MRLESLTAAVASAGFASRAVPDVSDTAVDRKSGK